MLTETATKKTRPIIVQEDELEETGANLEELVRFSLQEIQEQYCEDGLPWVLGFSGGKDSTALLQLVFAAIDGLPIEKRIKEIHVLSNDTLVENPKVIEYLDRQLGLIRDAGKNHLFAHNPALFHVVKTVPKLEDTFWLNMIGKGYPSPNRWFRWCTERMKINPTSDYIIKTVNKHGKAIILLGTRKDESANRAASMKQYELEGVRLRKHTLPNAFVFAPIAEMTNKQVWAYLTRNPNPWGGDNQELVRLYYSAFDIQECPLVIDTTTPSCGNSRFGCWTCTVVDKDKSMTGMVLNGEEWMRPLLNFRDWLKEIRDEEKYREKRRRSGQDGIGPFTIDIRKEILEKLLTIQEQIYPNIQTHLISIQELSAIQVQWHYDGKFQYSVAEIYQRITGRSLMLSEYSSLERRKEEFAILEKISEQNDVRADHIKELLELERGHLAFLRRGTIFASMEQKIKRFVKENEEASSHQELA
ncbi:MAG: DNA phosphorothioation system sulfurtransferase DndC [Candidatus Kapabacteria bacterium]|jgi:DNA sulfur modification protein DndC|nr:DNA phosphorothioation system sulfurtransferase DndC [Candidatus Kapabacteria bacterium]